MTDNPTTDKNEIEIKLGELAELYIIVKETILYYEEVNPAQKTDIQPINELRNAFDHMMRATAVYTGLKEESDPEKYILKHIDKSYGHVYRAGYDTVDYLCLTLKEYIYNALKDFQTTSIQTVLPQYYSEIKPTVTSLENNIVEYRSKKDIGENNHERLFDYIKLARKLGDYRQTIVTAIPLLEKFEEDYIVGYKKRLAKQNTIKNIAAILAGAISLIVGLIAIFGR